jgi:hypothetical protein
MADYGICENCLRRNGSVCTTYGGYDISDNAYFVCTFKSVRVPPDTAAKTAEATPMHEKIRTLGRALADLVSEKNQAYGSSFEKSGEFLRILYPDGLKPEQYGDALLLVRIFDKQMRIATRKDAFGESPFKDIAGYGLIGAAKDDKP